MRQRSGGSISCTMNKFEPSTSGIQFFSGLVGGECQSASSTWMDFCCRELSSSTSSGLCDVPRQPLATIGTDTDATTHALPLKLNPRGSSAPILNSRIISLYCPKPGSPRSSKVQDCVSGTRLSEASRQMATLLQSGRVCPKSSSHSPS